MQSNNKRTILKINKKFQHYIDLIIILTQKEMKVRYKSSFLGYLWSIIQPLAFAYVFFVAFKIVMRIEMENYTLFLITGLFPWQWFSNSVSIAPATFLANSSIIKKVSFPRNAIPLSIVMQDALHFILSIPVIFFFMFLYDTTPSLSLLYGIPLLLSIQFLMTYGLSLLFSSLNLFFRDLERLIAILLMFVFYFTPIIYTESMIPDKYKSLINLNPIAPLMISWRNLFLEGTLDPASIMYSIIYSVLAYAIGYTVYKKLSWKFAEVL